jgi:hypothetical protein
LTLFFKETIEGLFPEPVVPGSDDHVFRELLVTVFNRILLRLQDARLTEKELEEIGVMLRRTWILAQAYKARRAGTTLSEWIEKLMGTAKDAGVVSP